MTDQYAEEKRWVFSTQSGLGPHLHSNVVRCAGDRQSQPRRAAGRYHAQRPRSWGSQQYGACLPVHSLTFIVRVGLVWGLVLGL